VGAEAFFIEADEHDALLAGISHLPYLASVALVNAVTSQQSWAEMAAIAAGGFRSVSSLVDADERMWADIADTNRENILLQLDRLIERLTRLRGLLSSADPDLLADLNRARSYYRAWRFGAEPTPAIEPPAEGNPSSPRGAPWMGPFRRT
jgi:prephenate dehydrogenase